MNLDNLSREVIYLKALEQQTSDVIVVSTSPCVAILSRKAYHCPHVAGEEAARHFCRQYCPLHRRITLVIIFVGIRRGHEPPEYLSEFQTRRQKFRKQKRARVNTRQIRTENCFPCVLKVRKTVAAMLFRNCRELSCLV